jgi:hypothetical protein
MPTPDKPSPETLARVADELVGVPLADTRPEAVAGLLDTLIAEMAPLRAMDVGSAEPAAIYDPSEP